MIKLSKSQIATLQRLTRNIDLYYGTSFAPEETMHYRISPCGREGFESKSIIFQATNSGSPWYCSHRCATLIIGERGGVVKKLTSLDNMKASLIF